MPSGANWSDGATGAGRILPSISLVDGVERACCPRPVIDWAGRGMSGIERLAAGIEGGLAQRVARPREAQARKRAHRLPRQRKPQRGKLALLEAVCEVRERVAACGSGGRGGAA